MRVSRGRASGPSEQRGPTFTGRVWADPVLAAQDQVGVNDVFFEPGARTHWHRHQVGQVLYVIAGEGWLQTRAGDGAPLTPGDTAHIPAGEEHWHGARPDSYMMHLAISVGANEWLDPVTDEDYAAALRGR
jgi:quercetin dioxygenase-like cupin family protein